MKGIFPLIFIVTVWRSLRVPVSIIEPSMTTAIYSRSSLEGHPVLNCMSMVLILELVFLLSGRTFAFAGLLLTPHTVSHPFSYPTPRGCSAQKIKKGLEQNTVQRPWIKSLVQNNNNKIIIIICESQDFFLTQELQVWKQYKFYCTSPTQLLYDEIHYQGAVIS